jgi:hypothetical protein
MPTTNAESGTNVEEIADGIYRINTPLSEQGCPLVGSVRPTSSVGGWPPRNVVQRKGGIMRRVGLGRWSAIAAGGVLAGLVLAGPAAALDVGQKAPDFTLPAPGGKQVKLSDLTAKGPVVLYTFIQAFAGT